MAKLNKKENTFDIDAYQSVRVSLFGEVLKKERGDVIKT